MGGTYGGRELTCERVVGVEERKVCPSSPGAHQVVDRQNSDVVSGNQSWENCIHARGIEPVEANAIPLTVGTQVETDPVGIELPAHRKQVESVVIDAPAETPIAEALSLGVEAHLRVVGMGADQLRNNLMRILNAGYIVERLQRSAGRVQAEIHRGRIGLPAEAARRELVSIVGVAIEISVEESLCKADTQVGVNQLRHNFCRCGSGTPGVIDAAGQIQKRPRPI